MTRPRFRRSRMAATAAALLLLAACGGAAEEAPADTGAAGDTEETTETTGAVVTDSVAARDNVFDPEANEVAVGSTVTWTNEGEEQHNVIFDDGTESDLLATGDTYERTFDEPGEHPYVCTLHAGMEGVVTVTE